jgi:hypothetical protein
MAGNNGAANTISGGWRNQLGTRLELRAAADGTLTGSISSEVGGVVGVQPVVGYVRASSGHRGAIGLVVSWAPTHSVTTWCGHYDLDSGEIATNWLLTTADFDENEWQSTRVGRDVFHRDPVFADGSGIAGPLSGSVPPPTR